MSCSPVGAATQSSLTYRASITGKGANTMANKEKKLGYLAAWKLNLRAWGIWRKLCPQVFVSLLLSSVVKAVTPYVTIFLSARIIDELSGVRSRTSCSGGWFSLWPARRRAPCSRACSPAGPTTQKAAPDSWTTSSIWTKWWGLDYADVDRQAVFDLYAQIRQNENWAGWGIPKTISFFESFVTAVVQILGGVGLSVSLYLSPVPAGSGLAFLNHPLAAVAILGLMLLAAVVSPLCANRASRYWTDYAATVRQTNRILGFYPLLGMQRSRAADVRIYKQHENVCEPYLDQNDNIAPDSCISRIARGPMGLLNALSQCVTVALHRPGVRLCVPESLGGGLRRGLHHPVCGGHHPAVPGPVRPAGDHGPNPGHGTFLELNFEYLDLPNRMYQGSLTTEKRADRK